MPISALVKHDFISDNKKLLRSFTVFETLIAEIQKKELAAEVNTSINESILQLNNFKGTPKSYFKLLRKTQTQLLKQLEQSFKIVTKNHYRNSYMVIGMALGIAIGTAMGSGKDNMAYLGVGLSLGMAIGVVVGASMDKKALEEGRQLNVEIIL